MSLTPGRHRRKKAGSRVRHSIILIKAEGNNKTEEIYFKHFGNSIRAIKLAKGNSTDLSGMQKELQMDIVKNYPDLGTIEGDGAYLFADTDVPANPNAKEREMQQVKSAGQNANKGAFTLILSNPCFEVWFLAHFGFSCSSFVSSKKAFDTLKKFIPDYSKSKDVYCDLEPMIDIAIKNAGKLAQEHVNKGNSSLISKNPWTDVYKVVERLKE